MSLLKLIFIFFVAKYIENVTTYNPLLTYTMRFHKLKFYPNITGNFTINQYREKQLISGYLTINSKKLINKVVVIFNRCTPEGINCDYYRTWTLPDLCAKLRSQNEFWSPLYGAFDPPAICPLDKTYYQIKNASIDIGYAVQLYPDMVNYYWKVSQTFYADNDLIGSYSIDTSVFGYRKRNIKPSINIKFV